MTRNFLTALATAIIAGVVIGAFWLSASKPQPPTPQVVEELTRTGFLAGHGSVLPLNEADSFRIRAKSCRLKDVGQNETWECDMDVDALWPEGKNPDHSGKRDAVYSLSFDFVRQDTGFRIR